jgi:hypothetical protein
MFHATTPDVMSESADEFDRGLESMVRKYRVALTQQALEKAMGRMNEGMVRHILARTECDLDIRGLCRLVATTGVEGARKFFPLKKAWTKEDYVWVSTADGSTRGTVERAHGAMALCLAHGKDVPPKFVDDCALFALKFGRVDVAEALVDTGFVPAKEAIEAGTRGSMAELTGARADILTMFTAARLAGVESGTAAKRLRKE